MFILSPDRKTLTDEQGSGYFIQHLDDGEDAIACFVNDAVVFEGTEQECVDRMVHLAHKLDAEIWTDAGVLLYTWGSAAMLKCLVDHLKKLRASEIALDALSHVAYVLTLDENYGPEIERLAWEINKRHEAQNDSS